MSTDPSEPAEVVITYTTVPTSKDQCKHGGWHNFTDNSGTPFKNQGDCVSYVATGGKEQRPAARIAISGFWLL